MEFTKEQISLFVNKETVKEFAQALIDEPFLGDCDEVHVSIPIPRALYAAKLHNNYEEFSNQLCKYVGQFILDRMTQVKD